jgi:nitrite reductase (NADH) large subunit
VVISAGIRPNLDLAHQGGLETRQGILVDNHLRTSHPDVYAAGDAVEHQGIVYGTWAPSQIQGSAAGRNAAGQVVEFNGLPRSATLKVLGVNLFSIGKISPEDRSEIMIEAEKDGKYACFVFHDQELVGSILLGDTTLATRIKRVIEERQDCTNLLRLNPGVEEIAAFLAERIVD